MYLEVNLASKRIERGLKCYPLLGSRIQSQKGAVLSARTLAASTCPGFDFLRFSFNRGRQVLEAFINV